MKAGTLRTVRRAHNYLAVFFAPAILFFAFTGGVQTIGLHERAGTPRWLAATAALHQHQTTGGHDADGHGGADGHEDAGDHDHDAAGLTPLKAFVLLLSAALFATTALGLVIAIANRASRRPSLVLAVAGIAVPLALVLA